MGTISQLLKYKTEVILKDPVKGTEIGSVWVRILGDESIKDAYKYSRVASAKKRALLRDTNSVDYQDEVASLDGQDQKDLYDLVLASKVNDFTSEAVLAVQLEDYPELEDVITTGDPDAPTLEEQEILDKEQDDVQTRFLKKVDEFVATRKLEFETELSKASYEDLVKMAQVEIVKVTPMQVFIDELRDQKGFRSSYKDEGFKVKAFDSIEDYKETHAAIKAQIADAYEKLELGPDELKN